MQSVVGTGTLCSLWYAHAHYAACCRHRYTMQPVVGTGTLCSLSQAHLHYATCGRHRYTTQPVVGTATLCSLSQAQLHYAYTGTLLPSCNHYEVGLQLPPPPEKKKCPMGSRPRPKRAHYSINWGGGSSALFPPKVVIFSRHISVQSAIVILKLNTLLEFDACFGYFAVEIKRPVLYVRVS